MTFAQSYMFDALQPEPESLVPRMQTLLKDISAVEVVGDWAGVGDPQCSGFVLEWHCCHLQEVIRRGCIAYLG